MKAQQRWRNDYFDLSFEEGFLTGIYPGECVKGEKQTDYIRPGEAFGSLEITLDGAKTPAMIGRGLPTDAWEVHAAQDRMSAVCRPAGLPVVLDQQWQAAEDVLIWRGTITNAGQAPLEISDLGLRFPANSEFAWGSNAAEQVIGHHWIAGHNSHLIFKRCDGHGPYLMVLPMADTSLEYYDQYDDHKGSLTAYAHSKTARKRAVEAGARPHIPASSVLLQPGESTGWGFQLAWAQNDEDARDVIARRGLMDVHVLPGMTAPEDAPVMIALRGSWPGLSWELPEGCTLLEQCRRGEYTILTLRFPRLGENTLWLCSSDGRRTNLEFFITQPMETLLDKRGRFIAAHQHQDAEKWYNGLLAEWNNETGVLLGPDNYDRIKGWRIYEVTCDDPGLSKPAFLAGKLAERPVEQEVAALDAYVEHFVWGGLQCTEAELYPYAIYGIPDWKQLRDSKEEGTGGKTHLWRIYDYPHIALMYYNMYRIARQWPQMPLTQTAETYLHRAARTMVAMFTVPLEIAEWEAFKTGLYNEMVTEDIIQALQKEGLPAQAYRLERLWNRKAYKFAGEVTDLFGSEYPFDTTGFESTAALADRALMLAEKDAKRLSKEKAQAFLENQLWCNVACRGVLEMAYWWYGSDYRGDNLNYTLSYMSQMGGYGVLGYALYHARDPYALLRLGYGSEMSSWALLNAGRAEDNYGWRFPGKEHDGAASGGYEPLYRGETWLEQPHHGGAWYYSCEIDLGYCGYLRSAATIYVEDPIFGPVCMGGRMDARGGELVITPRDGVNRRFHVVTDDLRLHLTTSCGRIEQVVLDQANRTLTICLDMAGVHVTAEIIFASVGFPQMEKETGKEERITVRESGVYRFTY